MAHLTAKLRPCRIAPFPGGQNRRLFGAQQVRMKRPSSPHRRLDGAFAVCATDSQQRRYNRLMANNVRIFMTILPRQDTTRISCRGENSLYNNDILMRGCSISERKLERACVPDRLHDDGFTELGKGVCVYRSGEYRIKISTLPKHSLFGAASLSKKLERSRGLQSLRPSSINTIARSCFRVGKSLFSERKPA